jgi:hypothetical protein
MDHKDNDAHSIDSIRRRRFLGGTAATAAAALTWGVSPGYATGSGSHSQPLQTTANRLRRNINAPDFPAQVINTYALAVQRLLALPPEDPRNWYRIALTHLLDCPHANWWFLPWHRGYIGWFERICREITQTHDFALPYWDWTAFPNMPQQFFQGVLDPANRAFFQSLNDFERVMRAPLQASWNRLTTKQRTLLELRGYASFAQLWADATKPQTLLLGPRRLNASNPGLPSNARKLTSVQSLRAALGPRDFASFGSARTTQHSIMGEFGALEVSHNIVHDSVGGLMGDFMSPCDPIFWLHHANIDRIWEEWMLLQHAEGLPELPSSSAFTVWNAEPYEFFVDALGHPVTGYDSRRYAQASTFEYSYQGGTSTGLRAPLTGYSNQRYTGQMISADCTVEKPATGNVSVPAPLLSQLAAGDASPVMISITLNSPRDPTEWYFDVLLDADGSNVREQQIGRFKAFGSHQHTNDHGSGDFSFVLPLGPAVQARYGAGELDVGRPLSFKITMQPVRSGIPPVTVTCSHISVKMS